MSMDSRLGIWVRAKVSKGAKIGTYVGRVAVRTTGSFNITTKEGTIEGISHHFCRPLHQSDGYRYGQRVPIPLRPKERNGHSSPS